MYLHNVTTELLARGLLSLVFFSAAMGKLEDVPGTMAYMQAHQVPSFLLWPTIALELLGSAAILLGWQTRQAAALLAAFCVVTALVFYRDFGDVTQHMMFMKNVALAGGFLLLMRYGPGRSTAD